MRAGFLGWQGCVGHPWAWPSLDVVDGQATFCCHPLLIRESKNQRITAWFGLEGIPKPIQYHHPRIMGITTSQGVPCSEPIQPSLGHFRNEESSSSVHKMQLKAKAVMSLDVSDVSWASLLTPNGNYHLPWHWDKSRDFHSRSSSGWLWLFISCWSGVCQTWIFVSSRPVSSDPETLEDHLIVQHGAV